MGKFGWSYPPGCNGTPWDQDYPCEVCGQGTDDCICPECPTCGEVGNPNCYKEVDLGICGGLHNAGLTTEQQVGRLKLDISIEKDHLRDMEEALAFLELQIKLQNHAKKFGKACRDIFYAFCNPDEPCYKDCPLQ